VLLLNLQTKAASRGADNPAPMLKYVYRLGINAQSNVKEIINVPQYLRGPWYL
jgi:hypothetical protein